MRVLWSRERSIFDRAASLARRSPLSRYAADVFMMRARAQLRLFTLAFYANQLDYFLLRARLNTKNSNLRLVKKTRARAQMRLRFSR